MSQSAFGPPLSNVTAPRQGTCMAPEMRLLMKGAKTRWFFGALLGLQVAACRGAVDTPGTGGSGGTGPGGPSPPPQAVPIRRLTNAEYTASAADLFPGIQLPQLTFMDDVRVLNFVNFSSS